MFSRTREKILAAVFGLLERDNQINLDHDRFGREVIAALAEYGKHKLVFDKALTVLINAGRTANTSEVGAERWAAVSRRLIEQRMPDTDANFDEVATSFLVGLRGADVADALEHRHRSA